MSLKSGFGGGGGDGCGWDVDGTEGGTGVRDGGVTGGQVMFR